jgi:thioredoxin-dependent peroxiredoxin
MRSLRHVSLGACALAALALVGGGWLAAAQGGAVPKVGDKAPAFESTDDQGKPWKSSEHVGKKIVVLYFYPADFTGGCTAQACGFRDNLKAIEAKGVEVVGVSGDSVATHAKFKKDHKLNFTLLADEKGELARKFGIPTRKGGNIPRTTSAGDTFTLPQKVVILRWTVVIDREGNIAAKYNVATGAGSDHKKVLETVQKLQAK